MNAKAYLKQVKEAQRGPKEWTAENGIRFQNYSRSIFIPASVYEQMKSKLNETRYRKTVMSDGVQFNLLEEKDGSENSKLQRRRRKGFTGRDRA
jgi:hypothetical protein